MRAPTMGYIEPPDIPAGMTVQAWRRANARPRRHRFTLERANAQLANRDEEHHARLAAPNARLGP